MSDNIRSESVGNEWTPPERDSTGRYLINDWTLLRRAIEAARKELGEEGNIEGRDWNLALLVMDYIRFENMPTCSECGKIIEGLVIRCLDCKAPLHESCAARHFWPNGRPKQAE